MRDNLDSGIPMAPSNKTFVRIGLAAACLACFLSAGGATKERRGWTAYGGGLDNIHYSTLTQINRKNASKLRVAWRYDTGDEYKGSEMECNPIVVNGVLYATTPKLKVIALDAATGKPKWTFDPNKGKQPAGKMRNRGVTYWSGGDEKDERLFFAFQNFMYALSASTGEPVTSFGDNGRIDLRQDLGRDPGSLLVSNTTPPVVYKDLLITGSIVSETLPALPGDIRAYDVKSGKLRWSFHTIPHPGEVGYDTWPPDAWQYIGGANNWSGMSLDADRGILFVPTGSAAFDFYGANRLGDDLFANSLVALNAQTGKRIWHFQTVHHDVWDRDLPAAPVLVTVKRGGKRIDAVAQTTKSGYVFLFERATGKPLFPISERPYPASDVDGEKTAPTQPLPDRPPAFARQKLTEDMLTHRTEEAHTAALTQFRKLRSNGQFVPPSFAGTIIFPGFDGGAEWGGPAFDPETGLLYVNANEMAWVLRLVERSKLGHKSTSEQLYLRNCASCHRQDMAGSPPEFPSLQHITDRRSEEQVTRMIREGSGRMPSFSRLPDDEIAAITKYVVNGENVTVASRPTKPSKTDLKYGSDGYNKFLDPDGYPAIAPPWGTLTAVDLNAGKLKWQIPFGEYPELAAKGMRNTGSENYGGPVVTAGGVIFIAATNYDKKFHVFDKSTGKLLWETTLPAAGNATPAVYEVDGREYVVIGCGGGKSKDPSGGSYIAFTLGE
jgi:quinoprotein glucose dehydrogenase